MENASKALIMGASVLLFIIAISYAVYTYSTVMETTKSILTSSEKFAMSAEYFNTGMHDTTRIISAAEVVGNILALQSPDYTYNEVKVGEKVFNMDNVKNKNIDIKKILDDDAEYFISHIDYEDLKITYSSY